LLDMMNCSNNYLISIEKQAKMYVLRSMNLAAELKNTIQILNQNGIEVIALKGPVLAQAIYGSIVMRTSSDIDILIDMKNIPLAQSILEKHGYYWLHSDVVNTPKRYKGAMKIQSHFNFVKKGITIELHWQMSFYDKKDFVSLYEVAGDNEFNGMNIKSLSTIDNALFLMVHGSKHAYYRLRWLFDIYEMIVSGLLDINSLYKEAVRLNLSVVVLQALFILNSIDVLDMPDIKCDRFAFLNRKFSFCDSTDFKFTKLFYATEKIVKHTIPFVIQYENDYIYQHKVHYARYQNRLDFKLFKLHKVMLSFWRQFAYPNFHDLEWINLSDSLYWFYAITRPLYLLYRIFNKNRER